MTITFKVPTIACEACANAITKAIQNQQPDTPVNVDVANKIVTVETTAPPALIQQAIEAAGHTVEA
jgi:copper chaperone